MQTVQVNLRAMERTLNVLLGPNGYKAGEMIYAAVVAAEIDGFNDGREETEERAFYAGWQYGFQRGTEAVDAGFATTEVIALPDRSDDPYEGHGF